MIPNVTIVVYNRTSNFHSQNFGFFKRNCRFKPVHWGLFILQFRALQSAALLNGKKSAAHFFKKRKVSASAKGALFLRSFLLFFAWETFLKSTHIFFTLFIISWTSSYFIYSKAKRKLFLEKFQCRWKRLLRRAPLFCCRARFGVRFFKRWAGAGARSFLASEREPLPSSNPYGDQTLFKR